MVMANKCRLVLGLNSGGGLGNLSPSYYEPGGERSAGRAATTARPYVVVRLGELPPAAGPDTTSTQYRVYINSAATQNVLFILADGLIVVVVLGWIIPVHSCVHLYRVQPWCTVYSAGGGWSARFSASPRSASATCGRGCGRCCSRGGGRGGARGGPVIRPPPSPQPVSGGGADTRGPINHHPSIIDQKAIFFSFSFLFF